jgi:hypothetical protein
LRAGTVRLVASLGALLVLAAPWRAAAQVGAVEGSLLDDERQPAERTFSVGLSAAKIDEDWYARVGLGAQLRFPDLTIAREGRLFDADQTHELRIGLYAPLTVLLVDRDPTGAERFRSDEWDSPGEFLRILRRVEYGRPYAGVYLRGGELANVHVGHRTIVNNFSNGLDVDQFDWGFHGALNTVFGGGEVFVDDFAQPEVGGLRAYVRPVAFVDRTSWWTRFATGVSLVGDFRAPTTLATDAAGRYVRTERGDFDVASAVPTGVLGFDAELAAVRTDVVQLTPYTDVNVHLGFGTGWHTGFFLGVKTHELVGLDGRLEYRMLGAGYLPAWVGAFYETERHAFRAPEASPVRVPKLRWLQLGQESSLRHGYAAELGLNIGNVARLSGGWENESGRGNSLAWVQVVIPALQVVQFGLFYGNSSFHGARGFVELDDALAIAELRVRVFKWLFVTGQANRRWQLDADGRYEPVDDFAFGVSAVFGF